MNIKVWLANISRAKWQIETDLEDNGGELTEEILSQCDVLEDLKGLLAGEGIDELGRWLKSVQDELAARKAEADAAARKVKNLRSYEDYIKSLIGQSMDALDLPVNKNGEKVAKGSYYGFKRTESSRSVIDYELLNEHYLNAITAAVREVAPPFVNVEIKTSVAELEHFDAADYLHKTREPAVTFTKPRANNKKSEE